MLLCSIDFHWLPIVFILTLSQFLFFSRTQNCSDNLTVVLMFTVTNSQFCPCRLSVHAGVCRSVGSEAGTLQTPAQCCRCLEHPAPSWGRWLLDLWPSEYLSIHSSIHLSITMSVQTDQVQMYHVHFIIIIIRYDPVPVKHKHKMETSHQYQ